MIERVRERHGSVKVNTAFNGEFVTGDKRDIKSVNTKNYELYQTSDLDEWYVSRVIKPILASLDEFQERDSGWALNVYGIENKEILPIRLTEMKRKKKTCCTCKIYATTAWDTSHGSRTCPASRGRKSSKRNIKKKFSVTGTCTFNKKLIKKK